MFRPYIPFIISSSSFSNYDLELLAFTKAAFGRQPHFTLNGFKYYLEIISSMTLNFYFGFFCPLDTVCHKVIFWEHFLKGCLALASTLKASGHRLLWYNFPPAPTPPSPVAVEFYFSLISQTAEKHKTNLILLLCRNPAGFAIKLF